jgi:quercetin dioxygenase-like cupin family protein
MFTRQSKNDFKKVGEGIRMRTTVFGEKTLMTEFSLDKGNVLPSHKHPHEQTGYLVSGKMILMIGEDKFDVNPGDSWCVHSNVIHSSEIVEDSVAIEVFSPVREDYL